jgi:hypothetical protein
MLKRLENEHYETINDLEKLISKDEIHKFGRTYHFNAIALNQTGLKNPIRFFNPNPYTYSFWDFQIWN